MKKSVYLVIVLIVVAIIGIFWLRKTPVTNPDVTGSEVSSTTPISVSETTKVSDKVSEYQNAELGFLVKYPGTWEREEANSGVNFIIPIDQTQVSTIATLQSNVQVLPGTCAFPPVTTVKERNTVKVGDNSFNMISMSTKVQGRSYFNRMYSLQKGSICYMFSFASIALDPASKNLTGSKATQAENNNKAIVDTNDKAFTDMVKSFTFVVGPQGQDESTASPIKK